MKNLKKFSKLIVLVLVTCSIMFSVTQPVVHAAGNEEAISFGGIIGSAKNFIDSSDNTQKVDVNQLKGGVSSIYGILMLTAVVIAFVIAAVLGLKFLTGGVEEQAQVKKMLFAYVAGCIVVFGGFAIWSVAVNLMQQ